MATRKYGFIFGAFAVILFATAVFYGGIGWLLIWPASNFLSVATGYLGVGPAVFAKRHDGRLPVFTLVFLAPFLLYTWGIWHAMRLLSREPLRNELVEGIWIGRRLTNSELPDAVDRVVDLTAEFSEPSRVRNVTSYLCSPIMDTGAPTWDTLCSIIQFLKQNVEGETFIHCAQGHGRTALVSAAYLIACGRCQAVDDAIAYIRERRPEANVNSYQHAFLTAHESQLVKLHSASQT